MFAIVKTGGKQYRVAEGDVLTVEKLVPIEGEVVFEEVLLVVNPDAKGNGAGGEIKIGKPTVESAKVFAEVLEEGKGKKKMVFRYKSKTRQHKKKGHRQPYTKIKITKIAP